MKEQYINYLIKMLRNDRSILRKFWKMYPKGKTQCPDTVKEYKLQLKIIKALQALKEVPIEDALIYISEASVKFERKHHITGQILLTKAFRIIESVKETT